ncbi:hypothetical protein [Chryseobacterium sp. WX]|uniref:hypothetical protein n=1 Tax=Chryseobacterium sp. WX TaxID=3031803 RepID=UPI002409C831|nr:hypothetical protein [Chryseobacterium sp. WX]WFB67070.1 hypothetical protein PZ898_20500 [Chryseobacterium sp. WX]
MEANELVIGNWVYDCFKNREVRVWGIESNHNQITVNYANGSGIYTEDLKYIEPIDLTEEWLINLGYETDCDISENPMHFRKDGHLIWKPASLFYDDLYRIELKDVHQLQNLFFALKGKELTLK